MLLKVDLHIFTTTFLNFSHGDVYYRLVMVVSSQSRDLHSRLQQGQRSRANNTATGQRQRNMHSVRRLLQVTRSCRVARGSVQRRALGSRCAPRVWPLNSAASSVNVSGSCLSQWSGGWTCNGATPLVSFFRGYAGEYILCILLFSLGRSI